ncbi:MAG: hypothetical protein QOI73_1531 [Solirubrobacteraceae bacterium]|nr:hypothetical protein [Solirubrobacteraceae bacterium]
MFVCLLMARAVASGEIAASGEVATTVWMVVGALVVAHVATLGAGTCLAVLIGLSASGLADTNAALANLGPVQVTPLDVVFVILVGHAFFLDAPWTATTRSRMTAPARAGLALVVLMGASVIAEFLGNNSTDVSLTSWLRIVQAAVLAFLASRLLTTPRAIRTAFTGLVAGGLVLVAQMIFEVVTKGGNPLVDRFGGPVNEDSAGLVAAVLLVVGVAYPALSSRVRVSSVVAGLLGLFLAKSIGALLSVAVVVGALAATGTMSSAGAVKALRASVAVGVAAILGFGVLHSARSEALPNSSRFGSSTISHRIVVGAAGLELFAQHPLAGAGWQRSASPEGIGDEEINARLRARFPQVAPYFYPDVALASVHNAYIQVLAELGMLGGVLVLVFLVLLVQAARRLLREHGTDDDSHAALVTVIAVVGLVLLWWNENPLYGGQFEMISFALAFGVLIALSRGRPAPGAS